MQLRSVMKTPCGLAVWLACAVAWCQLAQVPPQNGHATAASPYLLLLRDPVVHDELQVTGQQRRAIRRVTDRLDGPLLALRNQSREEGDAELRRAIATAKERMKDILTEGQRQRLEQLVLRAQGFQALVRHDVSEELGLSDNQRQQVITVVNSTARAIQDATKQATQDASRPPLEKQVARIRKQQRARIIALLSDAQEGRLVKLLGPPFDTSRLGRIAFRSPEFPGAHAWINSQPRTLASLRGKVVALHFWTFG